MFSGSLQRCARALAHFDFGLVWLTIIRNREEKRCLALWLLTRLSVRLY